MVYKLDRQFAHLLDCFQNQSAAELEAQIRRRYSQLTTPEQDSLRNYLRKYPFWGFIDAAEPEQSHFLLRAQALHQHAVDIDWLYQHLADFRSKILLYQILRNWWNFVPLHGVIEGMYSQYFDFDIIYCERDEVFVDVGAFWGETTISFIRNYGREAYRKIYCYEITPSVLPHLREALAPYPNIVIRPHGLADQTGTGYLTENSESSTNSLQESGAHQVRTVTLDEDVPEPISFIKMDIEGGEAKALTGCAQHLQNDQPRLALAVYHNFEDLWHIPRTVYTLRDDYRFYLRYHGGGYYPTEVVLFAVP